MEPITWFCFQAVYVCFLSIVCGVVGIYSMARRVFVNLKIIAFAARIPLIYTNIFVLPRVK